MKSNHNDHQMDFSVISSPESETDYEEHNKVEDQVGKVDLDDFGDLLNKYLKLFNGQILNLSW